MQTSWWICENDKSRRISGIRRLLIWCGEGDLNPKHGGG